MGGSARTGINVRGIAAIIGIVALVGLIIFGLTHCSGCSSEKDDSGDEATVAPAESRVHFVAVGDNLPEDVLGDYADGLAGDYDDGEYDFEPIYAPIKPYIQSADLAYVKFEEGEGFVADPDETSVAVALALDSPLVEKINEILAGITVEQREELMLWAVENQPLAEFD